MDVTKETFDHLFPEIRKSIEDAAFIAIDGEFTGLSISTLYEPALYDTQETRYAKLVKSLSKFSICQCGLSMYVPSKHLQNDYTVYTYNFFLNAPSFGVIDSKFLCQASAIEFLSNHNFDFNMCFHNGVSYLSLDEERRFWQHHSQDTIQSYISSMLHRQYDEKFFNRALEEIGRYVSITGTNNAEEDDGSSEKVLEINYIPKGLPQYLFLKTVEKLHTNLSLFVKKNGNIVVKLNANDEEKHDYSKQYDIIARQIVGFSSVMRLISDLQKPIIGHNMLADLVFIYKMFYHSLPITFSEFKCEIHKLFPIIYDTKHIAFSLRREFRNVDFFDCTSLGDLYDVLSSSSAIFYKLYTPQISHADGFDKYTDSGSHAHVHEAGYDAYLTGYVFLRLAHLAATKNIRTMESRPLELRDHLDALSSFRNCVNITRAALRYLNFEGPDPPCNFPERFIVRPKTTSARLFSANQVAQDFLPWGSVDVKLRSPKEALVAVSHRKASKDILQAFRRNKFYRVVKYRWYHSEEVGHIVMYTGCYSGGLLVIASVYLLYQRLKS